MKTSVLSTKKVLDMTSNFLLHFFSFFCIDFDIQT